MVPLRAALAPSLILFSFYFTFVPFNSPLPFSFSYWALHRSTSMPHRCYIDGNIDGTCDIDPHRCHIDLHRCRINPHRCHIDTHRCNTRIHIDGTSMPNRSTSMPHRTTSMHHRSTWMPHRCHIDPRRRIDGNIDATSMPDRRQIDATSISIDVTSMPHQCCIDRSWMPHRCHIDLFHIPSLFFGLLGPS